MKKSIASMLLVAAYFPVYAQDSEPEKTDQERAEDVCSKKPDVDLQMCIDETVKKWNDPTYKAELKRARNFAQSIFAKCKSMDSEVFDRCAEKENAKFKPHKVFDLSDFVGAAARTESLKYIYDVDGTRKNKLLAQCEKMHIKSGSVRLGMTAEMIKVCGWGVPESINRSTNRNSVSEQWVYGVSQYLYLRNGILESIQD